MFNIWLDDIRDPPKIRGGWIIARDYKTFRQSLQYVKELNAQIGTISFDHDLGENSKDGYDCIKLCASPEFCEIYPLKIEVHSANPVGRENILKYDEWYRRMRKEAFEAMEDV